MAMPAAPGRRFESRRRNRKTELLYRLFAVGCICCGFFFPVAECLGSMATLAASYGGKRNSITVCAIVQGGNLRCWHSGQNVNVSNDLLPGVRFEGISGGSGVVCGVVAGGLQVLCWDTNDGNLRRPSNGTLLSEMAVGGTQICGLNQNSGGLAVCWRWRRVAPPVDQRFSSIAVGTNFACGIDKTNRTVKCWGPNAPSEASGQMVYVSAGGSHACGITATGRVTCWGEATNSNASGVLNVPEHQNFEFDGLALGANHSCARRRINGTVVCWGSISAPSNTSFETIVSGDGYACGIVTSNLTVLCWGGAVFGNSTLITALPKALPWPCQANQGPCPCGKIVDSDSLCGGPSWQICQRCAPPPPPPSTPSQPPPPPPSTPPPPPTGGKKTSRASIALATAGGVGVFMGLCSIIWCLYFKFFRRSRRRSGRVYDSGQQTSTPAASTTSNQTSRVVRRQRSGPSKARDRPEEFTLADLVAATDGFSDGARLGAGSFGTVYRGTLPDDRRVAIKRSETTRSAKKHQENTSAFESELNFLSRLHHKHLVALVGYCEEDDERLLVYEYMPGGSLHDHLHKSELIKPPMDSWATRIKLALDAARGVEYLHTYAVPPIIHRDIKSSNILLDATWNAKVADFGLSLLGPDDEDSHLSLVAAGTVGYIDPEYYKMQHLTTKSDVYSFGVVLMELLTGKRAIHKHQGSGGSSSPRNVVDYALPYIVNDDLASILDRRLPPPRPYEIEAVVFVGATAAECVNLEGKDRPSMTEVANSLEMALAYCAQGAATDSASRRRSRSRSSHGSDDLPPV